LLSGPAGGRRADGVFICGPRVLELRMCRLFGYLGARSAKGSAWLVESDRSLLAQSHVSEENAQRDGWGIAWYGATRLPRIERGIHGAFDPEERPAFETAAREAQGPVILGHLRHASNPMDLPRARLLAPENSQPFGHESTLFVHSGMISLPRETRPHLGKFEEKVRGVNDSEVLFWLLHRYVEESGDPLTAYSRCRRTLEEVWKGSNRRSEVPYTGLNVIYTRGPNEIWAFCHWLGEHGGQFYDARQPYYRMGFETDTKSLVIGSEPFAAHHPGWHYLDNGQYLVGQVDHGLVGVKTGPIP
jgi:predicted glutamine amidotransferase